MGSVDDGFRARMREAVADAVADGAERLRGLSAPGLIGLLAASALAPVVAAAAGAGLVALAGAGVIGSVGANVLTDVATRAIAQLRTQRPGVEPTAGQIQTAVAQRIEAAFTANDPTDRQLRAEVVALFRAVDVAGAALEGAARADGPQLETQLVRAFAELATLFGEFGFMLVNVQLSLEAMHQDLRRQMAQDDADRERRRQYDADFGRAIQLMREIRTEGRSATGAPGEASVSGWEQNPYQGLLPFEERHAPVFYGRRQLTSRLLRRLDDQLTARGLMLVLGPSGAGKSSLLRAGLLASLADDGVVYGCRWWPRRILTPTADPMLALAFHMADLASIDAITVHEALVDHPEQAHLLAAQVVTAHRHPPEIDPAASPPRLVLVIDQMEELFTLVTDRAAQTAFLTALQAMATLPALPDGQPAALVVAGLRGDFLNQATGFVEIRDAVEAGPFMVGPMSESELREAITGPAAEAGVQVPDELATTILDDLRDRDLPAGFDTGALPLLSQAMFTLWQSGPAEGLTLAGYRRTGGVATIVDSSAEQVYGALTDAQQALTHRVFIYLAGATDGRLTRRPTTIAALQSITSGGGADLQAVLEAFTTQRLITRTDPDIVAIAHEELLHSWTRLRDWLQPAITDQALHRAMLDDARSWHEHQRDPSYLYRGSQLLAIEVAARRWADNPAPALELDPAATEFLTASQGRDRWSRRVSQVVTITLSVLLVVAVGATILALFDAGRADEQHVLALSRQLSAQSQAVRSSDWTLSQRLAAAALHVAPTREASDAASSLLTNYRNTIGHDSRVSSVAFSPDGRLLATACQDGKARLWNPATGKPVGTPLAGHSGPVKAVAFSPDGRLLATASNDRTVWLWNPATGKPVGTPLAGQTGAINAVAFSPDGRRLATVSQDGTVQLWDPATEQAITFPMSGHVGAVNAAAFSPDGQLLATGGGDGTIRLWDATTGLSAGDPLYGDPRYAYPLDGHSGPVLAVAFSPRGGLLVSAGEDGSLRFWDLDTVKPSGTPLVGHSGPVNALAFSPDGQLLATASDDRTARLWDPDTRQAVGTPLTGYDGPVSAVAFSPHGQLIAIDSHLWDPAASEPGGALGTSHTSRVSAVALSPDRQLIAAANQDGTTQLWDRATGKPVGTLLTGQKGPVDAVAFSLDGHVLATASRDGSLWLWNPATGRPVSSLVTGDTGRVNAVAFRPDGRLLATSGQDGTVRLWNPSTRKPIGIPLTGHTGPVNALAFSPDGRLLATGSQDGTVRLWNPSTRKPIGIPLTGHTGSVNAVAFSPDGQLLATASDERTVRLWNPALYADPIRSLCDQAGGITRDEWTANAAGEPFFQVCPAG